MSDGKPDFSHLTERFKDWVDPHPEETAQFFEKRFRRLRAGRYFAAYARVWCELTEYPLEHMQDRTFRRTVRGLFESMTDYLLSRQRGSRGTPAKAIPAPKAGADLVRWPSERKRRNRPGEVTKRILGALAACKTTGHDPSAADVAYWASVPVSTVKASAAWRELMKIRRASNSSRPRRARMITNTADARLALSGKPHDRRWNGQRLIGR